MEPRKIVGSVDTSEVLVAVAASAGFLLALGSQGIHWSVVLALLLGGVVAAPIAAWLVQRVTPRLLGAAVGGVIVLTNVRTIFEVADVEAAGRWTGYGSVALAWLLALGWVVRAHRRDGEPLLRTRLRGGQASVATEPVS